MIKTTKRKLLENKSSIAGVRNETDHENNELFTYMCVCACVCVCVCVCVLACADDSVVVSMNGCVCMSERSEHRQLILPPTVVFIKVT